MIVSNPVDILTYYCDRRLGLPNGTVVGTGCILDTSRLVRAAADYFNIRAAAVNGYVKTTMLLLAVTLHNIPEGMAVGVIYAGLISDSAEISAGGALALALGIAIQNVPEGAIISMPLHAEGKGKSFSFFGGVLSGAVEPIGALITILVSGLMVPVMPYLLSFAAGAMIYVVVEELIPEMSQGEHSNVGVIMFALGFTVMMVLDVALG